MEDKAAESPALPWQGACAARQATRGPARHVVRRAVAPSGKGDKETAGAWMEALGSPFPAGR